MWGNAWAHKNLTSVYVYVYVPLLFCLPAMIKFWQAEKENDSNFGNSRMGNRGFAVQAAKSLKSGWTGWNGSWEIKRKRQTEREDVSSAVDKVSNKIWNDFCFPDREVQVWPLWVDMQDGETAVWTLLSNQMTSSSHSDIKNKHTDEATERIKGKLLRTPNPTLNP